MSFSSWWEQPLTPPAEGANPPSQKIDPDTIADPSTELLTRRIHILGTGSIGTLVAHSLKLLPHPPPVTLMLHRHETYERFRKIKGIVRLLNKNTGIVDDQRGYDLDLKNLGTGTGTGTGMGSWTYFPYARDGDRPAFPLDSAELMESGEVFIYTLIVTVKGPSTIEALESVKHRVDSRTTILFMQNGMGQIDALNERVFTDPATRPTYMLGIISHGCYMQGQFIVVHAGMGTVALGVYRDPDKYPLPPKGKDASTLNLSDEERARMFPTDEQLYSSLSSRYLLRTLTRCTPLACAVYPYLDLLQLQLEKLVANCVLNPLTALLDVQNGEMLNGQPITRVQRLLIAEISLVLRNLPELEGVPNVQTRFSSARLEQFFRNVCDKTAQNSSSMREDIRHARETEIDWINGYVVKRGDELGIRCVLNYLIMQLVKSKTEYQHSKGSTPYGAVKMEAEREGDIVQLEDQHYPLR